MSDEYIRRQDAIDIVRHECGEWKGLAKEIVKQFNGLLSADVAPVRHARWERYSGITIRCSRCEHVIHDWRLSECKYCPNCGAKMDGKRREE